MFQIGTNIHNPLRFGVRLTRHQTQQQQQQAPMTLSPVPSDLAELYPLMSVETLARHLDAVVAALAAQGVEITPVARLGLEEIAEAIIEHHARHDVPALRRHLALVTRSDSAGAEPAAARVHVAGGFHVAGGRLAEGVSPATTRSQSPATTKELN